MPDRTFEYMLNRLERAAKARTFEYMLNRLERAAKAEKPAEAGYAFARNEILRYVRGLEALRDDVRLLAMRLRGSDGAPPSDVHP